MKLISIPSRKDTLQFSPKCLTHLSKFCPSLLFLHPAMEDQVVEYLPTTSILHHQVQSSFCFYHLQYKVGQIAMRNQSGNMHRIHNELKLSLWLLLKVISHNKTYTHFFISFVQFKMSQNVTHLEEFDNVWMIEDLHDADLTKQL